MKKIISLPFPIVVDVKEKSLYVEFYQMELSNQNVYITKERTMISRKLASGVGWNREIGVRRRRKGRWEEA